MIDLWAELDGLVGDEVLDRLVERPDLVDALLDHEVAAILDPEVLDILRQLRAAQHAAARVDGEVIVTDARGDRRYGA